MGLSQNCTLDLNQEELTWMGPSNSWHTHILVSPHSEWAVDMKRLIGEGNGSPQITEKGEPTIFPLGGCCTTRSPAIVASENGLLVGGVWRCTEMSVFGEFSSVCFYDQSNGPPVLGGLFEGRWNQADVAWNPTSPRQCGAFPSVPCRARRTVWRAPSRTVELQIRLGSVGGKIPTVVQGNPNSLCGELSFLSDHQQMGTP